MATGKGVGGNKSKGGMDWGSSVRSGVVQRPNDSSAPKSHVSGYLSAAVVVLCALLVILIPVLAVMWGDLNHALDRAEYEIRKMQDLRKRIYEERRNE